MAVYTNLDWKDSVRHECYEVNEEISLVHMSEAACWKKDGANYFKDGTWVVASKKAVAYAMDPRNYLSEASIFQFESLSCIEGVHKLEAVEKILESTELKTKYTEDESGNKVIDYPTYNNVNNVTVKMEKTYAQVIYEAGLESGVSPIHIAARIIQETGGKLSMGSISGTNPGFEGYYNFFNIGAVPGSDNNSAVTNGLKTAKNNGWDSPEKAIKAGALTLYNSYIKYGQDTVYFQKFDVSNSKGNASMLYAFQYMTNIMAPNSESSITYSAYSKLGILDSAFVFYIPVYENMTIDKNPSPESEEVIDENNIEKNTYNEKEEVKVINVNSISVTKSNYSIKVGESINIDVKVLPDNATNTKYVSSIVKGDSSQVDIYENEVNIYGDSNVIKLEGNKVTALKTGEALVLFKTVDGEYTTSVKVTVTEKSKFEVDKEKLTINENGVITNLGIGSKVKDVLSAMNCSDNVKIECRDISGNILNDESLVGTGMSISLLEADLAVLAKYDVVIKGDVNGDAKITASDYVIIKNFIMGTSNLEKVQTDGADVNKDGKITASDYVLIKNHIMGTAPLY
ncbi:MAG: hypothetical protein IJ809_06720 [Clostridia bacterium]|nr:hypothetical protein [Clostridia bacterium]